MTARTVIITGGTKGIGQDIAKCFYREGFYVALAARSDNGFAAGLGERARFFACDVRNPADLHKTVQAAVAWTGGLDVFINNAGYSGWMPVERVEENFWDDMIDTNLKGVFFGCQAAAAHMKKDASIINISSLAAKRGTANNAVYCASKFAVGGITQALAKELGPRGIRVNAVCPVLVPTEGLLEALRKPESPAKGDPEGFLSSFAASQSALGRLPTGKEVGEMCVFLASPAASAITGQNINVDCGVLPQ